MMRDVRTAGKCAWSAATLSSRGTQIISRDDGGWCGLPPFEGTRFLKKRGRKRKREKKRLQINTRFSLEEEESSAGRGGETSNY